MRRLEVLRTDATEIVVATYWIVELLNVFGYVQKLSPRTAIDSSSDHQYVALQLNQSLTGKNLIFWASELTLHPRNPLRSSYW